MNKVWLLVLFSSLLIIGCSEDLYEEPSVDEESSEIPDEDLADLEIYTRNNVIFVEGVIAKNTPCHELEYELSQEGQRLILDARIYLPPEDEDSVCAQVIEFEDINLEYEEEGISEFEFVLNNESQYVTFI